MPLLPPEAIAALERDELIDAIKITRERTGLGLKEAKDAVEAYRRGDRGDAFDQLLSGTADQPSAASVGEATLPAAAALALQRGAVIEAIKLTREATGLGLAEAKALVDAHREQFGTGPLGDPMAEPGRVKGGGGLAWLWLLLILALGAGLFYVLHMAGDTP